MEGGSPSLVGTISVLEPQLCLQLAIPSLCSCWHLDGTECDKASGSHGHVPLSHLQGCAIGPLVCCIFMWDTMFMGHSVNTEDTGAD